MPVLLEGEHWGINSRLIFPITKSRIVGLSSCHFPAVVKMLTLAASSTTTHTTTPGQSTRRRTFLQARPWRRLTTSPSGAVVTPFVTQNAVAASDSSGLRTRQTNSCCRSSRVNNGLLQSWNAVTCALVIIVSSFIKCSTVHIYTSEDHSCCPWTMEKEIILTTHFVTTITSISLLNLAVHSWVKLKPCKCRYWSQIHYVSLQ
jgi:hypothetical protein